MEMYARRVQELQHDLRLPISSFDDIGMPASRFLWEIAQKQDNSKEEEGVPDEQYSDDYQYEQDRLTDTYSEYFRDDFNAGDKFTSQSPYIRRYQRY